MKRMWCVVFALMFCAKGWSVENGEKSVPRETLETIERQMEYILSENKTLTAEERKSLVKALSSVRARTRESVQGRDEENRLTADMTLFEKSPAYGFLNAKERAQLHELTDWAKKARSGVCASNPPPSFLDVVRPEGGNAVCLRQPDELKRGDLVFRRAESFLSHQLVEASSRERRFSHVGVVISTVPTVLILSVGDGAGVLKRAEGVSWASFMTSSSDCAVYRFAGGAEVGERIARAAERRVGIPFDPAFDLKTKDRLYCSELVRDAVNEATGKTVIGTTKRGTFEYVAIDDCYRSGWIKVYDVRTQKGK